MSTRKKLIFLLTFCLAKFTFAQDPFIVENAPVKEKSQIERELDESLYFKEDSDIRFIGLGIGEKFENQDNAFKKIKNNQNIYSNKVDNQYHAVKLDEHNKILAIYRARIMDGNMSTCRVESDRVVRYFNNNFDNFKVIPDDNFTYGYFLHHDKDYFMSVSCYIGQGKILLNIAISDFMDFTNSTLLKED